MRSLSLAGRLGFAVSIALLALAVSRWAPIEAQSPLDVRALALAGPALGFAILAALTGRDRRPGPWRRVALALVVAVAALGLAVALRGPAGLAAEVSSPAAPVGRTTPGAIDVIGRDLRSLPIGRRVSLRWAGELRVPAPGRYELWVEGRGRAAVSIDGHAVLEAEGDPLQASTAIGLAAGPVALLVAAALVAEPDLNGQAIAFSHGPILPRQEKSTTITIAECIAVFNSISYA